MWYLNYFSGAKVLRVRGVDRLPWDWSWKERSSKKCDEVSRFPEVLVQCRTNLTRQLIWEQIQVCKRCESSDLAGNRACRRVQNCSTVSTWLSFNGILYGFWYNVVLILPDKSLELRDRYVSSVRAPIAVGIFPTKITRLVWGDNKLVFWDRSFDIAFLIQTTYQ